MPTTRSVPWWVHFSSSLYPLLQDCYKRVNSNLTFDRLRFRHRRSVSNLTASPMGEISLKSQLTVLDGDETKEGLLSPSPSSLFPLSVTSRSLEQCLTPAHAPFYMLVILGGLAFGFCLSTILAILLCCRLKRGKKESFEVYGAYQTSSVVPSAYRY